MFKSNEYDLTENPSIIQAAGYDYALSKSFDVQNQKTLAPSKLTQYQQENLSEINIKLQDHIFLMVLDYDIQSYWEQFENDIDAVIFPDLIEKSKTPYL